MKYFFLAIGAVIVVALAAWIWWPRAAEPQTTPAPKQGNVYDTTQSVSAQPSVTTGGTATSERVTVPTADGGELSVKRFMPEGTTGTTTRGGDFFLVGEEAAGQPYRISYYFPQQSFTVMLLQEPLRDIRNIAEKDLSARLDVSEIDLCRLNYLVVVPGEVNATYAGKNLGFSFCLGATYLP
jgi:hypothetical protein